MDYSPWGRKESDTTKQLSLTHSSPFLLGCSADRDFKTVLFWLRLLSVCSKMAELGQLCCEVKALISN